MKKLLAVMGLTTMAALLAGNPAWSQPTRDKARFVVNMQTEHQIFNGPLAYGQKVCFDVRSLATGAPAAVRLRRTENGKKRDLDVHTGGRCLTMHRAGGWYVVYATPVNEDIVVYADAPGATPIPIYRRENARIVR